MDIQRIVNAQNAFIEVFPNLKSAVTAAVASRALSAIVTARGIGVDPFAYVAQAVRELVPAGFAPELSMDLAALVILEADNLWMRALGEAPAPGDER